MSGFRHDIAGGDGTLIATSVQSPGYATGSAGWQIRKDGSAEFNNLDIRGTFNGTDFIINASGAFFYSAAPAAGNLIASVASAGGTDSFGNTYYAGVVSYQPGASPVEYIQLDGGLVNISDATFGAAEAAQVFIDPSTSPSSLAGALVLLAGGPFRGSGGRLYLMPNPSNSLVSYVCTPSVLAAFDPASGQTAAEGWHSVALAGITIPNGGGAPTGRLRYKLLPANEVVVDCDISFFATSAQGSVNLATLGTGYVPANGTNWPVRVYTATAPANLELTGGVTTGGVVFVNNIPTGANTLSFYQAYPLD